MHNNDFAIIYSGDEQWLNHEYSMNNNDCVMMSTCAVQWLKFIKQWIPNEHAMISSGAAHRLYNESPMIACLPWNWHKPCL